MRPNGFLVLVGLVVAGMGASSVFWHWQAPKHVEAARRARDRVDGLSPEERLDVWLGYGQGIVHSRLLQLRLDWRRPWLVTHVVEPGPDPSTHEIWGVDLTDLRPEVTHRHGMVVAVELPAARHLGPGPLTGDKSVNVPRYRDGTPPGDPDERAAQVVEWALEGVSAALEKDIEGATLEARVGDAHPGHGPGHGPGQQDPQEAAATPAREGGA